MAETRYVQRDPVTGEVTGHFANPQDYAKEALPIGHPDLLAFQAKREAAKVDYAEYKATMGNEVLYQEIQNLKAQISELQAKG